MLIDVIFFLKQNKGLTELDTDVEASSVIPDASESTIADNDDRADFLAQTTSGYIPAPQVIFKDFVFFGKLFFPIFSRIIRILMEHKVIKSSFKSKLQTYSISFIRILNILEVISLN